MLEKVPEQGGDGAGGTDIAKTNKAMSETTDVENTPQTLEPVQYQKPSTNIGLTIVKVIVQAILVVLVLVGAFALTQKMIAEKPEPRKRRAFKTVYTIDTVTVERKQHQPKFTAYGQTVAARTVDLRALVSGEVVNMNAKLNGGALVIKGDALVEIDAFNYAGALTEAEANLEEAKAKIVEGEAQIELEKGRLAASQEQLKFAVADLSRALALKKRGNSTQKEVDTRRLVESQRKQAALLSEDTIKIQQSRLSQLNATVARLQWRVKQAQRNLDSTVLVAPFDGVVKSSSAEIGRVITANDVVVSLYEAGTLEVRFTLTDAQYGRLQTSNGKLLGRNVTVAWTVGGKEYLYPAKVDRVGAEISSTRGGVEIFAAIDNSVNAVTIRPGAFVEVRVPDQIFNDTISIPDTAVYGVDTVYVEVDGKLERRKVAIAAFSGEQVLITTGLNPGDKVLTTRITEVSEGLRVRREGDAEPKRGKPSAAGKGRPTPEEIAKIAKNNGISLEEFRALPTPDRRKMVQAFRKKAGQ